MGLCFLSKRAVFVVVLLCASPASGYEYQGIADCEYDDNIKNVVYLVKNVFNQKLNNIYDSRVGKYVGFGEYGMINAAHYNSQGWKMAKRKIEVETLCRYNARYYRKSTLDRKVPPIVKVHLTKPARYGYRTMLECSVLGFYPQEVRVSWLRDGVQTTTDVSSTDILANGDWSFQLHYYLELIPKKGERISCRVDHSSLVDPLEVEWDTSALDAKLLKMTAAISFLFIGFATAAGGAVYYWWKKRCQFQHNEKLDFLCNIHHLVRDCDGALTFFRSDFSPLSTQGEVSAGTAMST